MSKTKNAGKGFRQLVRILDVLRGDDGCPWDKEQDEKTILHYFLEEVYEAVDAVSSQDAQALAEELGDVLMEVVFLAKIYEERGEFTISDVLEGINKKMIRRHPHVFGQEPLQSSDEVRCEWARIKNDEKGNASLFGDFPKHFPALLAAFQIGFRASEFGFDWGEPLDALQKVKEEVNELERAVLERKGEEIEQEMGDVLFSLANVSRLFGINPEAALSRTNNKFLKRIHYIEKRLREKGKDLNNASLIEMDEIWEQAKIKIA